MLDWKYSLTVYYFFIVNESRNISFCLELTRKLYSLIEKYNVPATNFEFQVLYGVPMNGWLQKHMSNKYKVRVYLPYGPQWYEYSIRRLKENPNIARYVAKSIFSSRNY